jgi:hypothetical protein
MSWTLYGILIVFGAFVLLMILNPRLSCFGKRIVSPFYPLMRKKRVHKVETEDYGFHLIEGDRPQNTGAPGQKAADIASREAHAKQPAKPLKTVDYGFHLVDLDEKEKQTQKSHRDEKEES